VRERDLAGGTREFIAEGEVVLRVLIARRVRARIGLSSPRRAIGLMSPALSELGPDIPSFVASEAVMSRVVGFPIHRGVLAIGPRGPGARLARFSPPVSVERAWWWG
jgi:hypothetical protein